MFTGSEIWRRTLLYYTACPTHSLHLALTLLLWGCYSLYYGIRIHYSQQSLNQPVTIWRMLLCTVNVNIWQIFGWTHWEETRKMKNFESLACYPDCVLHDFPQPPRDKPHKCFKLGRNRLVSHPFQFVFAHHHIIRYYIFRASESVVK
jgi:hypothetical protein